MKDYGTLSQAINKLKLEEGYENDFNLLDEHLELQIAEVNDDGSVTLINVSS